MSQAKTPRESAVVTRHLVMPQHANPNGALFGGQLVSWIDLVAAMAASRHSGKIVVTASMDEISFLEPISVGDQIILEACVNYVGRTSMEVGVRVSVEDPFQGSCKRATQAYLTFVAMNEKCDPTPVSPLQPETSEEVRRYERAKIRVQHRKELRKKLQEEYSSSL